MKRFYHLCAALTISATTFAAEGSLNGTVNENGWLIVQDFQASKTGDTVGTYDTQGNTPAATVKVAADPKDASNLVAECVTTDYNAIIEIPVTLPAGKTIADYGSIAFDLYRFSDDDNYKEMHVLVDDTQIEKTGYIEQAKAQEWTVKAYPIASTVTSKGSIKIRIGMNTPKGHYAIDNVRLEEKSEWLTAADFDNGETATAYDLQGNTPAATIKVIADPKDASNKVVECVTTDYNAIVEIPVTLPAGKTIADFKAITFDFYRFSDDDNYKEMFVLIDDNQIEKTDYIEHAKAEEWTNKRYELPADITSKGTVKIRIGLNSPKAHYAIDNVKLLERAGSSVNPPVGPSGDFDDTANGTVTNGVLMVNDFQHHNAIDATLPMWNYLAYDIKGNAKTAADPDNARNLVASMSGENDMNTIHEMEVTLPEGKKLADYSELKFDLYRNAADDNYKNMYVQADNHKIHADEGYPEQATAGKWVEKSYTIDPANTVGNSFKLRLGILSDKPDYLIDNVRLVERQGTTGIDDITSAESDITVTPVSGGIAVTAPAATNVKVYAIDGKLISDTRVDGTANITLAKGLYIVATASHIVKTKVN